MGNSTSVLAAEQLPRQLHGTASTLGGHIDMSVLLLPSLLCEITLQKPTLN